MSPTLRGLGNVVALAVAVGVVAACHGGASDVVGGGVANAHTSITLVAYSAPNPVGAR